MILDQRVRTERQAHKAPQETPARRGHKDQPAQTVPLALKARKVSKGYRAQPDHKARQAHPGLMAGRTSHFLRIL